MQLALARRGAARPESHRLAVADLVLDEGRPPGVARRDRGAPDGHRVHPAALPARQRGPGRDAGAAPRPVWHYDFAGESAIVESFVSTLRKKLEAASPGGPALIHRARRGLRHARADAMTLQRRLAVAVAALLVTLVVAAAWCRSASAGMCTRQLDAQVAALVARPQATLSLAGRRRRRARRVLSGVDRHRGTHRRGDDRARTGQRPGLLPRVAPGEVLRVPSGARRRPGTRRGCGWRRAPSAGGTCSSSRSPTQRADAAMGRLALTLSARGRGGAARGRRHRRMGAPPRAGADPGDDAGGGRDHGGGRDRRIPDAPGGQRGCPPRRRAQRHARRDA